jgi:hypothetical protein
MEYRLTAEFMARCVRAKTGMDEAEAIALCATIIEVGLAMNLILEAQIRANERHAKARRLIHMGLPPTVVAARMSIGRSTLFRVVRSQIEKERAALRAAS